jgi:hypothetical protein
MMATGDSRKITSRRATSFWHFRSMSWRSSLKEQRNVSADANEKPMKALFHPRMDPNIRPGDHAS